MAAKVLIATASGGMSLEIKKNLEKYFYQVVCTPCSIPETIRNIQIYKPDISIIDLFLKDGSGLDVIRDVRENMKDVRIIALASSPDKEMVVNVMKSGVRFIVSKPIDYAKLVDNIRTLLG